MTKVFHNTNLSYTIRSNQTILLNEPVCLKLNFKSSTTFTRSCISSVKPKYRIIELHTTHSLPSPICSINIYYTSSTLSFCKEIKWESIIIHTKSIGEHRINLTRFGKHKMSNSFLIRITTVIIVTTLHFTNCVHSY